MYIFIIVYSYCTHQDEGLKATMEQQQQTSDGVRFDLKQAYPSKGIRDQWDSSLTPHNGSSLTVVWLA